MLTAGPLAAAALVVGVIAAVVLSLGGEQPRVEAGSATLATPTDGLTVEPLGTAPPSPSSPLTPPKPGRTAPGPNGLREATPPSGATLPRFRPRAFVLNGTIRNGVATEAAKLLQARGANVTGTGNATLNTVTRSVVYSTPSAGGRTTPARTVSQLLGLPTASELAPPELSALAPGAEVVVLLGSDYLDREDRRVPLTGKGGARGVVVLLKDGGLSFTAEGLPPSDRYFLWGENRAGKPVGLGFAAYDKKRGRVAGEMINSLPGALASVTERRLFLTRERTSQPKRPGEVVLDSGRIPG